MEKSSCEKNLEKSLSGGYLKTKVSFTLMEGDFSG